MARILLIEDDDIIRQLILDLLDIEGFEVISAEDGQSGLQLAQEQIPDLILCNVTMPDLDGYQVFTALRQNPVTQGIPFIFLTAQASKDSKVQALQLGASGYITKPFSSDELIRAISNQLQMEL